MKNKSGLWGEIYASRFLRDNGCEIYSANYATRLGEVDLVALDGETLVFAEVKARGENMIAAPAEAVDTAKMRRITLAAAQYIRASEWKGSVRFDVIEVYLDSEYKAIKINQIKAAFDAAI